MARAITRRAAARILLAGPAALALPNVSRALPAAGKRSARPALSDAERREVGKSVEQLRKTVEKLRKAAVPMGLEPAFVFHPLLPKK